ncbi:hypothetical protein ACHAW5_005643 [Stephanodiscus triporus]|uniref:Uncharacterized protein n=1 Tax=Stephanodiscus triporus TaxID=2934178 RepID=A0ABD3MTG9_9STRA
MMISGDDSQYGALMSARMGHRLFKTGKFMPAGLVSNHSRLPVWDTTR